MRVEYDSDFDDSYIEPFEIESVLEVDWLLLFKSEYNKQSSCTCRSQKLHSAFVRNVAVKSRKVDCLVCALVAIVFSVRVRTESSAEGIGRFEAWGRVWVVIDAHFSWRIVCKERSRSFCCNFYARFSNQSCWLRDRVGPHFIANINRSWVKSCVGLGSCVRCRVACWHGLAYLRTRVPVCSHRTGIASACTIDCGFNVYNIFETALADHAACAIAVWID